MIKLINLTKEYNVKSGKVLALDNINCVFPRQGLVFLLGKSGCGKSTLLNLLGGLDSVTSGDILVNDKSLSNYKAKELDDYRNTKIGFIFQDFNLIEEYNVYENIAIVLNLRGDVDIKEKVAHSLRMVDLEGYEKRRINELSGGQKQRIAIARAIATNKEIILADEPTGNLDSENSKDVFNKLKSISENKLVIIVTHDKESAEAYADAIIHIVDGKIKENSLIIESDEKNDKDCELPRIVAIENSAEQCKVKGINILSLTKLSLANIWKKKFRLLVTIVLFFFMLSLCGLGLAAARYDKTLVAFTTLQDSEVKEIKASKSPSYSVVDNNGAIYITDENKRELEDKFQDYKFNYVMQTTKNLVDVPNLDQNYMISTVVEINDSAMQQYDYEFVWGRLPTAYDEVCISKYIMDKIIELKLFEQVTSYDDLQSFSLKSETYSGVEFKVVGIVDTNIEDIIKKLQEKNPDKADAPIFDELKGSFSKSLMVSKEFMDKVYYSNTDNSFNYSYYKYHPSLPPSYQPPVLLNGNSNVVQESYSTLMGEEYGDIIYQDSKNSLDDNEIIVSYEFIENLAHEMFPVNDLAYGITREQVVQYLNSGNAKLNDVLSPVSNKVSDYNIIGFYTGDRDDIVVNDNVIKSLNPHYATMSINTSFIGDKKQDIQLVREFIGEKYVLNNYCSMDISSAHFLSEILIKFGFYASIGFGLFSIVMMANFIITSINTNKKQIGVLRALGMKSSGIIYIFLFEAILVGLFSFVLSAIAVFPLALLMSSLKVMYVVEVPIILITVVEIVAMLSLSIVITCLSSIIPIIKKARTQPIKLIKE